MRKLLFLLGAVYLGFALGAAQAGPLDFNPWTPGALSSAADSAQPLWFARMTKPSKGDSDSPEDTPAEAAYPLEGDRWIKAYGGYDFAFLDSFINALNAFTPYEKGQGDTNVGGSTSHDGLLLGLEIGQKLDEDNRLSVDGEWVQSQAGLFSADDSGSESVLSIAPSLFSASVNYERTLLRGSGIRTYVSLGGGFYHSQLQINETVTGTPPTYVYGLLTGNILGGTVGAGEEFQIGSWLSLTVSARFRAASFSQVTAGSVNVSPNASIGNGPYTFYTAPPGSGGLILSQAGLALPPGYHVLVLDYSGFDGDLSLKASF
jgi:hypothetical protein